MALDLGGTKKKQDVKTHYSIIEIDLFKPTRKKYPEIDYEELRRNQLREGESSGEDERFHDREAMEMVRRLEAKYGNKKTKKGKKIHFGTEDDFIDKGAGYDLEDAFIDDSEAYDELIPSTLDTVRGGFYVNKGKLEFKSRVDEADESDISEDNADDVRKSSKGKKRIMVESDEEAMEEGESAAPEPQTSKASENVAATVESVPKNVPTSPIRRMAGAPPTKKFASAPMGSSPAQRAAQAIKKKRLGGLPPMLNKAKLLKKATKPPSVSVPGVVSATSTNGDVAIQKAVVPSTTMVAPSPEKSNSAPSVVPSISPSVSVVDNTSAAAPKLTSSTSENDVGPSLSASSSDVILSSPTKKTLPPLTDTLSTLLSDFKTKTAGLATPGLKKRLQNHHVDMVIRIEDQCLKDGFSNHEKSRVLHSLADYCGIQKNSLHVRIQKRKDELKQPSVQPGTSSAPMLSPMKQASVASSTNSDIQVLENTSVFKKDAMKKVASSSTATAKTSTDLTQQQQQFQDATNMIANLMKSPGVTEQDIVKLATVAKSKDGNRDFMRTYQEIMLSAAKKVAQGAGTASAKSNPTTPSANSQPTPQKSSSLTVKSAMNTTAASPKAATSAPKMSLSQVIEKQAPVARPSHAASVSKNIHEIKRLLDAATESVQKAITTALSSGERIYQDKCTRNAAAGKAPPTFVFLWTEFLLASLDKLLDVAYQAVYCTQPNCTSTAVSENIYSYIKTNILPLFRGRVRIGQLLVEICRRYPERSLILAHPSLKKDLADEGIDLQKVSISSKKSVDVVKTKKSINMPSRPSSKNGTDADIQVLEGDGTLPSTSFASTNGTTSTNGVRSKASGNAGTPSTSSSTSVTAADPLAGITPQDLANIQQSVQQLTAMGATPDQIATVKQTMLLGAMQNAQANMLLKSQQQSSFAAKEARKKEKEEEKMRQIAQRKAEMAAQKQKLLEEKKKKIEEEKRQKAAEKAQKLEEERLRRLKEQEERERRIQEENDRKIREEQERKRIEEEKLRKIQEMKVKVEQQEAREKEQQRLAQMREDARKQEEERVRLQQEKAAAARVAALSASETKPLQKSAAPTVPPPVATEAKPLAHNSGSTSNMSSYSAGFASPQNTFHSPHNNTLMNGQSPMQVPSSPQYGNGFAYPGSHGSGSIGQSPQQQLTPMTPPMHRSPFQQQQMQQQSPYSTGAVQSPVAAARTAPVMAGMSPQTHLMPQQQQQQLQMNGNSGHYPSVHQQHQQHANMNGSSGMPGQFVPTAMNGSPAAQSYPQQQQQQYYQQQNQQQQQQVQHQHVLNQQQQCQQTQMAAVQQQQQQQQQRMQQQQMYQQQQQQAMAERQLQERYRQQQMFNQQQSYQQHNQNNGF